VEYLFLLAFTFLGVDGYFQATNRLGRWSTLARTICEASAVFVAIIAAESTFTVAVIGAITVIALRAMVALCGPLPQKQ